MVMLWGERWCLRREDQGGNQDSVTKRFAWYRHIPHRDRVDQAVVHPFLISVRLYPVAVYRYNWKIPDHSGKQILHHFRAPFQAGFQCK